MELRVKVEDLRKHSLYVAAPMYGGMATGQFTSSCIRLAMWCARYDVRIHFDFLFNESLVQRARNYLADNFLRSDYTHMLFIDADIGFKPEDVLALLAVQTSDPEKYHVVTGPYPKKTIAWEKVEKAVKMGINETPFQLEYFISDFVFNPVDGQGHLTISDPVQVSEAGTGFMLIPRQTFDMYAEAHPELKYLPDHKRTAEFDGSREITAFFDCAIDPATKRYLSEDYFFCHNVRKMGQTVWMLPWLELQHVGTYIFKGSMGALMAVNASPTTSVESNPKNYKKRNGPSRR